VGGVVTTLFGLNLGHDPTPVNLASVGRAAFVEGPHTAAPRPNQAGGWHFIAVGLRAGSEAWQSRG